ncbi:hypothetical protein V1289_003319 [Bradyrhizobium sp. AZCC 2289]
MALHRARQAMQNAFIESFNGRLHDELLNETLFYGASPPIYYGHPRVHQPHMTGSPR